MSDDTLTSIGKRFYDHFDVDSPELANHYDEIITELHKGCPVAHSPVGETYWVINRYDDVNRCAKDWETFSSTSGYTPNRPEGQPYWYPVECDPPLHAELRRVMDPHFTPKAVAQHEPKMHGHAHALIDEFIADGRVDAVSDYSNALPGYIFLGEFCGMPLEDLPWLHARLAAGITGPKEHRAEEIMQAWEYFEAFLKRRSEEPHRDDVVGAILDLQLDGYGWAERTGTLAQTVAAGLATTGHVTASALWHLAEHPDDRAALMENPKAFPRAVEEFVRMYAASPFNGRRATADTEVAGTRIEAGDFVLLGYGVASRDPLVCPNPDVVDIARSPNRHVGFGAGPHRCIGSHLARLELTIGLKAFLERIPEYRIAEGFEPEFEQSTVRSLISLPIEFDVPPAA